MIAEQLLPLRDKGVELAIMFLDGAFDKVLEVFIEL